MAEGTDDYDQQSDKYWKLHYNLGMGELKKVAREVYTSFPVFFIFNSIATTLVFLPLFTTDPSTINSACMRACSKHTYNRSLIISQIMHITNMEIN